MIYFTADLHFYHDNIIKHCNRPFQDSDSMNNVLINNWNDIVNKNDEVYILGDLSFKSSNDSVGNILDKLNGRKYLILGNHDRLNENVKNKFAWVKVYYELRYKEIDFILFHYPIESWNKKFHDSIHVCGHTHNSEITSNIKNRFNVGVDVTGFKPVSIEELIEKRIVSNSSR